KPQSPTQELYPAGRRTENLQTIAIPVFHEGHGFIFRNDAGAQHTTHGPHTQLKRSGELPHLSHIGGITGEDTAHRWQSQSELIFNLHKLEEFAADRGKPTQTHRVRTAIVQ